MTGFAVSLRSEPPPHITDDADDRGWTRDGKQRVTQAGADQEVSLPTGLRGQGQNWRAISIG